MMRRRAFSEHQISLSEGPKNLARNSKNLFVLFRWMSLLLLLLIFLASAYVYSGSLYLDRLAKSHAPRSCDRREIGKG